MFLPLTACYLLANWLVPSQHMSVKSCTSNAAHVQNVKLNCHMWLSKNNPMLLLSHMPKFIKIADFKHLIKKTDPCDWFNYQSVSHNVFYLQGTGEGCCSATGSLLQSNNTCEMFYSGFIANCWRSVCIISYMTA